MVSSSGKKKEFLFWIFWNSESTSILKACDDRSKRRSHALKFTYYKISSSCRFMTLLCLAHALFLCAHDTEPKVISPQTNEIGRIFKVSLFTFQLHIVNPKQCLQCVTGWQNKSRIEVAKDVLTGSALSTVAPPFRSMSTSSTLPAKTALRRGVQPSYGYNMLEYMSNIGCNLPWGILVQENDRL